MDQLITPNVDGNTLVVYFGVIGQGSPLNDWYGDCLAVARNAFGIVNPIGSSAWDCYTNHNQFNHGDRNWPTGVYFFVWFSGYGGLGHVAIAYIDPNTGAMTIWTSPYMHKPDFDHYNNVDRLASGYGVTYVGWSEDMGGIRVIQPQASNPPQGGDDVAIIDNGDNWKGRANKSFLDIRGRQMADAEFTPWIGQDFLHLIEALEDDPEADQHFADGQLGAQARTENWQGQMQTLQTTGQQLQQALDNLNASDTQTKAQLQATLDKVADLTKQLQDAAANTNTQPTQPVVVDPSYFDFGTLLKALWQKITKLK